MGKPAQQQNMSGDFSNTAKPIDKGLQSATHRLEGISRAVGERAGEFASQVSDYYETGERYIRDNPVKSAAIAAGAGVIFGGLLAMALRPGKR